MEKSENNEEWREFCDKHIIFNLQFISDTSAGT